MTKEAKEPVPVEEPTYTDPEVVTIMITLGQIYAMDDAIYNQEQLRRPETYIQPLRELRNAISKHLTGLTSKGKAKQEMTPGID